MSIEKLRDVLYRFRDLYCQNIDLSTIDEFIEEYPSPSIDLSGVTKEGDWKLVGHSYQIADTGDYDGHWEITNGKISIHTKDDNDEGLQEVVNALNNCGAKFYMDDAAEFEAAMYKRMYEEQAGVSKPVWVKASEEIPAHIEKHINDQIEATPMTPEYREQNRETLRIWAEYGYKLGRLDEAVAPEPVEEKIESAAKEYFIKQKNYMPQPIDAYHFFKDGALWARKSLKTNNP